MALNICRMCRSTKTNLSLTIFDEVIAKFLDLVPSIELSDDLSLSINVCQLCHGKASICCDFAAQIVSSQASFNAQVRAKKRASTSTFSSPQEVIKKMQCNSGISIKKVPVGEAESEIIVCSSPEPEELLEEVETVLQDFDSPYAPSDDIFEVEDDSGSDVDYKPNSSVSKKSPQTKLNNRSGRQEVFIDTPISFTCAKCKNSFPTFDTLSEHMKERSCTTEVFACDICDKEFATKRHLSAHKQTHKPKHKVMCEVCGKDFSSQFDLDTHMESVHERVVKRDCIYRCTYCQATYHSHLELLEHVRQHNKDKKEAPRLCEVCARTCPNLKSYQAHMASHLPQKKSFVCEICQKGFTKGFQLTQHMHIHTGIKAFVCNICQRGYAKRDSLRTHKKKEHPE